LFIGDPPVIEVAFLISARRDWMLRDSQSQSTAEPTPDEQGSQAGRECAPDFARALF
jgi:hypothetical protein